MSAIEVQPPIWVIDCDGPGCEKTYSPWAARGRTEAEARSGAAEDGWHVRPSKGPGSRSGPDLCPDCWRIAHAAGQEGHTGD